MTTGPRGRTRVLARVLARSRLLGGAPMARYLLMRVAFLPVSGFLVATISFFLMSIQPVDVALLVLGNLATASQLADFRHAHGFDLSVWERYARFLGDLAHGSLGTSYYDGAPVTRELFMRLPSTLELVVVSFVIAFVLGTSLGALSAYFRGSRIDGSIRAFVSAKQAIPSFVLGLLGSLVLVYTLHWLPVPLGQTSLAIVPPPRVTGAALVDAVLAGQAATAIDALSLLVLPALTLGLGGAVPFARIVRATLAEALDAAHTEFARSRGVPERTIVWLAFRSSILPAITYAGIVLSSLIGGNAIIETMFNWPGIGQWAIGAIYRADLPAAQAFILFSGIAVALVYFATDLLVLALDPRIARPAPMAAADVEVGQPPDETGGVLPVAV